MVRQLHADFSISVDDICWTPSDKSESENTLITRVHHASREQADANWQAFGNGPEWQRVTRDSEADGEFLARPPKRIFLRPTDSSLLR